MTAPENPSMNDWAGARGEKWLAQLGQMEAMLAPADQPLIARLELTGARRIADLACGGGGTTLAVAKAADPDAAIFGYDISPALVGYAQHRAAGQGAGQPGTTPVFAVADSATLQIEDRFDRIISRFGTMFFPDPASAFANIAQLLAPGGRFALAVWGPLADNYWMGIIRETVGELVDL
ncbi:MAG: class I SAM-dependent methyltransferase, partial [Sphingomonas sp.]|nr:class I SAM-dependent methyltransferase [Sphingomonas sp.]